MTPIRLVLTYVVVFCGIELANEQHPTRASFLAGVWTLFFLTLLLSGLPEAPPDPEGLERDRVQPDRW